ncbi:zinc finger protein 81-like [Protopterus annectens]|uniref:zinc finger protein 81-like n=1 Tax=Protopterus annectens TaxID=7888 RepID=UPI001CFAE063|nr:zinc finger protein 81-like [Protopterus annectens]
MKLEVPETFEDVAVMFSDEEWAMLNKQEKELYQEVMVQNFENMISIGCHIPVEHLWMFVRKGEKTLADDTEGRLVKKKQCCNIVINRNADFTEIQSLQPFHGKCHDDEHNKALLNKMLMRRKGKVKFKTRNVNYKEKNKFINKIEMHLKGHGGERLRCQLKSSSLMFHSSSQSDKLIHSMKKHNNNLATKEQICNRKKLHNCAPHEKDFKGKRSLEVHEGVCTRRTTSDKGNIEKSRKEKHHLFHIDRGPDNHTKCDQAFPHKGLPVHESNSTWQKSVKCGICEKTLSENSMINHEKIHTGYKPYKCNFCDKSFKRKYRMICHENIHTGQKPYKCTICDKSFNCKGNMMCHETIHTGKKPYKCATCDKGFRTKQQLIRHQHVHTGQKPYKCATCDKGFVSKPHLTRHQNIHTDQKPYTCPTCDKGFISKHNLAVHEYVHTGQKPYKCATCDKSFTTKGSLVRHQIVHTGQKPYKCPTCDKGFARKHHLTEHQNVHTNQKPYKCATCDKGFTTKRTLVSHQIVHTGHTLLLVTAQ